MKKFINLCLFRSYVIYDHNKMDNMPSFLWQTDGMFKLIIKEIKKQWFRLGKGNAIQKVENDNYQMSFIIATPIDMVEFLEWYNKQRDEEKTKVRNYFHSLTPEVWTSTYQMPLKNERTYDETMELAIQGYQDSIKQRAEPSYR